MGFKNSIIEYLVANENRERMFRLTNPTTTDESNTPSPSSTLWIQINQLTEPAPASPILESVRQTVVGLGAGERKSPDHPEIRIVQKIGFLGYHF
jgi:hypothetical protein